MAPATAAVVPASGGQVLDGILPHPGPARHLLRRHPRHRQRGPAAGGRPPTERALSVLAAREQRWELYERLAVRAGVDLSPLQLWLLARLGERAPTSQEQLLKQLPVDGDLVTAALQRLREQRLVGDLDGLITLTVSGRADYERLVAARCAGLRELLAGWNPDEHPELRELIDKLGRDLVSQIPTPAPTAT
jgi:DNA-binding MarR family transcriptional regulator